MPIKIWCYPASAAASPRVAELTEALGDESIRVTATETQERGPSIALHESLEPAFEERLRAESAHGLERILALDIGTKPPPPASSWRLLAAGASDVLRWRGASASARDIAARLARWREVDEIVQSPRVTKNLVGASRAWIMTLRQIVEAASFGTASVLLEGETGSGKELAARLIHTLDRRADRGELVVVDCANIVPTLSGSEFFGHERGAYTGAAESRQGAFELADRGTLFLDEVGELPLDLQGQLLRVIQERKFKRVGGNTWLDSRFRLIAATHRDLERQVAVGAFRSDLYHRIASVTCRLPSLHERRADVLLLTQHFLLEAYGEDPPELDDSVRDLLLQRSYSGNVRDLRQLVLRIGNRHVGRGPITVGDVPIDERPVGIETESPWESDGLERVLRLAMAQGLGLEEIGRCVKERAIQMVLAEEKGSISRAARRLGVTDRALQLRRAVSRRERLELVSGGAGDVRGDADGFVGA